MMRKRTVQTQHSWWWNIVASNNEDKFCMEDGLRTMISVSETFCLFSNSTEIPSSFYASRKLRQNISMRSMEQKCIYMGWIPGMRWEYPELELLYEQMVELDPASLARTPDPHRMHDGKPGGQSWTGSESTISNRLQFRPQFPKKNLILWSWVIWGPVVRRTDSWHFLKRRKQCTKSGSLNKLYTLRFMLDGKDQYDAEWCHPGVRYEKKFWSPQEQYRQTTEE